MRNKEEAQKQAHAEEDFDRQEVIKNTKLNAQLVLESSAGEEIRAKLARKKSINLSNHSIDPSQVIADEKAKHDHLKWDEINLYKTEQEKAATMKIDEPKTPYEGGFNPKGEYYREDEDEDEVSIPDFTLGESQFDASEGVGQSLNGGEVIENPHPSEDSEPEEKPLLAEEKHKRFEEMRKAHYHNAAKPLHHNQDKVAE